MRRMRCVTLSAAIVLAACGGSDKVTAPPLALTGSWCAPWGGVPVNGFVEMSLTQSGSTLTGHADLEPNGSHAGGGTSYDVTGELTGGSGVTLRFAPTSAAGGSLATYTGTATNDYISGSFGAAAGSPFSGRAMGFDSFKANESVPCTTL